MDSTALMRENRGAEMLSALPPDVLPHILSFLSLQSRSRLRQSCTSIYRQVEAFESELVEFQTLAPPSLRDELVAVTEQKRWLPTTATQDGSVKPGPSHLCELFIPDELEYKFYYDAKLVDDHLLVLYNEYWDSFQVFDLKTRQDVNLDTVNGPERDYRNYPDERIRLLLSQFDGRHGLLAAGMRLSCSPCSNPHGTWSGPYLTVWEIQHEDDRIGKNIRMRIDLRRPEYRLFAVSVVSPNRCAVLLVHSESHGETSTAAVVLQWHRIPDSCSMMSGTPPPPPTPTCPGPPPPSRCSTSYEEWSAQDTAWENYLKREANKDSLERESDQEYPWWSNEKTLLREDIVDDESPENGQTEMHCSGGGILVVLFGRYIQFWHVGTMRLVRTCDPFAKEELSFHRSIYVTNFVSHTTLCSVQVRPGEGYQTQHVFESCGYDEDDDEVDEEDDDEGDDDEDDDDDDDEVPNIPPYYYKAKYSLYNRNDVDLAQCDAECILTRFAHETRDQQWDYENGICGIHNGSLIERSTRLPAGSCSPQLECIVRVAFTVHNSASEIPLTQVVVMDVHPFRHIREREFHDMSHTEAYANACLRGHGLWGCDLTQFSPDEQYCEQVLVLNWERGGQFDFPDHGESDMERSDRYDSLMDEKGDELQEKIWNQRRRVEKEWEQGRTPLSLQIDAQKLTVCTSNEVSVWPLPIDLPGLEFQKAPKEVSCLADHMGDEFVVGKELQPWYLSRPLDEHLLRRWKVIKAMAIRQPRDPLTNDEGEESCESQDDEGEKSCGFEDIARDIMGASFEEEEQLLSCSAWNCVSMSIATFSWRYAVLMSSPPRDYDSLKMKLHVFDVLGNWARIKRPPFHAEGCKNGNDSLDSRCVSKKVGIFLFNDDDEDEYDDESYWKSGYYDYSDYW